MSRPAPLDDSAERAWERARDLLLTKFGPQVYQRGVESLRLSGVEDGVVRLTAPDAATARWMETHHPGALEEALHQAGCSGRVSVTAGGGGQGELFPDDRPNVRRRPMRFGSLVPRYTFATFVIGTSNQFAQAACRAVASQLGRHYNPLFLYGGVGLGKTHLANAIGHETLLRDPQARVAYLSAEAFMTQLITDLRRDRMEEFKNMFRKVDLLIVDDVQFLANRERTQEEFFHTFNALHESRRQIVLTSDKVPKDIPALEERLRNRFEWGLIADIQPPDMETRVAILEKKADLEGLALPREVAVYLASQVDSNVRELEGYLTRISAFASLAKAPITEELARGVLKDVLRNRLTVSVDAIQQAVCQHYGVRVGDLISKKRTRNFVVPRQIAMYLARKMTNLSFPAIGDRFGGRDHSTVIHAHATVERWLANDEQMRATLDAIQRAVHAQP